MLTMSSTHDQEPPNGLLSQLVHVPSSKLLSESWALLQKSHFALAKNQVDVARKDALSACNLINQLLAAPDENLQNTVSSLAQYTLAYCKRVSDKRAAALLAQERFCWLISRPAATGGFWYPNLKVGEASSADIAPLDTTDDNIGHPDFGPENPVTFRDLDHVLLESLLELSIDERSLLDFQGSHSSFGDHYNLNFLGDLFQDVLTNCSFVLSLLSISQVGLAEKLRALITVFDNGTAKVRLFMDGCWREAGITTKLPFFEKTKTRNLCVRSLTRSTLLWPALIEKAYVTSFKEHYSFNGSNMANDTFMLTGWVPEIRAIEPSTMMDLAELWKLKQAGKVMIGFGTGSSSGPGDCSGIIRNHDYLLADFNVDQLRCTLMNPWSSHKSREKRFHRELCVNRSLFGHFKFLYLNWKRQHKHEVKTFFVHSPSNMPTNFLSDKPQFHIGNTTSKKQDIVILVEMLQADSPDFCVSVWKDTQHVIYAGDQFKCVAGGKFVNSKYHLVRLEMEPGHDYVISIVTSDKHAGKFALTVYHDMETFQFGRAKSSYDHTLPVVSGSWTHATSGGSWTHETFINNPQYDFELTSPSRFMLVFACDNKLLDVNLHLLSCKAEDSGKRIREFNPARLLFNEAYLKQLFLKLIDELEPGHYKIVVSTLRRGDLGECKILLAHDGDSPVELTQTPQTLGTFIRNTSFEWKTSNRRKLQIMPLHNKTEVVFHLRLGTDNTQEMHSYRPSLRASVFDAQTRQPIVITDQWSSSVYGVFLDCCLPAGGRSYILLIERFETGDGTCRLTAGSSHRVSIEEYDSEVQLCDSSPNLVKNH